MSEKSDTLMIVVLRGHIIKGERIDYKRGREGEKEEKGRTF